MPDDFVHEFAKLLRRGRNSYAVAFLTTLELNKLESKYQKKDEPMIFRKQVDELGIVLGFTMNPVYKGRVPKPKTEFTNQEVAAVIVLPKDKTSKRFQQLAAMFTIGNLEHRALSCATQEELNNAPPPIWKQFDADGFPEAYAFNVPIELMGQ